jgi:hypothetical protein
MVKVLTDRLDDLGRRLGSEADGEVAGLAGRMVFAAARLRDIADRLAVLSAHVRSQRGE